MVNVKNVGEGKVVLLSGGGKVFTDVAARFVGSNRDMEEIISSEYDSKLVKNILNSGHLAATEFDYFIFGVEGFSRVTETQLVRKRIGSSYCIKSGRSEKHGERKFDVVMPNDDRLQSFATGFKLNLGQLTVKKQNFKGDYEYSNGKAYFNGGEEIIYRIGSTDILNMIEQWYNVGVECGLKEEELRYLKPQGTEFKAIIGMNARSLFEFFNVRCCKRAQTEIRDMANQMLKLCKEASPDLFAKAGANCVKLGYCPENRLRHKDCNMITHNEVLKLISEERNKDTGMV